jgi:hypothetical protein
MLCANISGQQGSDDSHYSTECRATVLLSYE